MLKKRAQAEAAAQGFRLSLHSRLWSGAAAVAASHLDNRPALTVDGDQEDLRELADMFVRRFGFSARGFTKLPDEAWVDLSKEGAEVEARWTEGGGLQVIAVTEGSERYLDDFVQAYVRQEAVNLG
jgi:hypothetical protein